MEGKYKPGSSGETGTPGLKHWNVEYGPSTSIPDSSIKDIVCKLHIIRQKEHKMGQVSYFDHIRGLCSILLNQHKAKIFISNVDKSFCLKIIMIELVTGCAH